MSDIIRRFDSLDALIERATESAKDEGDLTRITRVIAGESRYGKDWMGTETFDDALKLAREGWTEIRPDIDRSLDAIRDSVREVTQRRVIRRRGIAGGSVNVARMLSGEPRCMTLVKVRETPRSGRVVRVVINCTASHRVSGERIKARGAAVAALVEAIHLCGMSTEVTVMSPWRGSGKGLYVTEVTVKDAESRFDINSFMFAVAHPSMLRRIIWATAECESIAIRKRFGWYEASHYGMIAHLGDRDMSGYDVVIDSPDNSRYANDPIESDPVEWIRGTLTGIGLIKGDA